MNTCDICFTETRNSKRDDRGNLECTPCREARAYYSSLSPSELRAEHESMARHVEDERRRERTEGVVA